MINKDSSTDARSVEDGTISADPQAHQELAMPGGQRAFCVGCARDIEGEPVAIPTSRETLLYAHDNPTCLENAMSVAEDPSAGVVYPGKPKIVDYALNKPSV